MTDQNLEVVLRRFERPDEVREMVKGRFEVVRIGSLTVGRATYQPGWKWSEHVGVATVAFEGRVGDEPYVSLHFLGADSYAR